MNKLSRSVLYIISAASATGKTSLIRALLNSIPNITLSISHTTRSPRGGEKHGVDYYFISQKEFDEMVSRDEFLEHATVHRNNYGTSKAEIQRLSQQGIDIALEIDWQGAQQIRKTLSNTVSVFILPPSREELELRISSRRQDSELDIKRRLTVAGEEISHCVEYDFIIVNDDFEQAFTELRAIVQAERCRQSVQVEKHKKLLTDLIE